MSLDDLLAVVREILNPEAARSGLDRCLRRHGVGNLRDLQAKAPSTRRSRPMRLCMHAILQESPRKRANNSRAQTPALLKGLIFSETGAAMTPTSTKKGAKLYRYYVSMDVIRNRETGEETAPMRLAAGMVEDAVVTEARRILQTPEVVTQVLAALKREQGATSETDAIVALHEFDALWGQFFPAEQARIIQLLVRRVTVTAAGLEVDIRREGIAGVIREMVAPRRMQAAE